jgi:hypothetical protein
MCRLRHPRGAAHAQRWDADKLAACTGVILAMGVVLTALSLGAIAAYDR